MITKETKKAVPALGETKEDSCINFLGHMGAMLSGSKSHYSKGHPLSKVFFNANVYDALAVKRWFGDLDITKGAGTIQALCNALGETLYVTREMPYRFMGMFNDKEKVTVKLLEADALGTHPDVIIFTPEKP